VDARSRRPRVLIVLAARADRAAVAGWCDHIRALLHQTPGAIVECDVGQLSGSAAAVVDTLARLRLVACGSGGRFEVLRADPALLDLLYLLGFADLLPVVARE
jgi:hypothetical protein